MSKMDEVLAAIALSTNANTQEGQNCKPNLLDNWYWLNPVNQRGATGYTQGGYGIDRWRGYNVTDGVVSSSGITYSAGSIYQVMEATFKTSLAGRVLTMSALLSDGSLHYGTQTYSGTSTASFLTDDYVILALGPSSIGNLQCGVQARQSITVAAVKLELGDTQTLAHQENSIWVLNEIPNYGEQLLLCQRYYQRFHTQSLRPVYAEDFRPTMRLKPSLGTITIDDVTYYVASADT